MNSLFYIGKYFLLNMLCPLIPHPKLRAKYLKALGARIGRNVRIENVKFIQIQYPLKNLKCSDNVFVGSAVILDLSSEIFIGRNSVISPGCSLITHQDAGEFIGNKISAIYPKKYLPIAIKDDVWIGCDSTILPGTAIESMTVIGAKSLVSGAIPGMVMAAGIPAKVKKKLNFQGRKIKLKIHG